MTDRELFEITLDALEEINKLSVGENAICLPAEIDTAMDALRERLAQPEQELVIDCPRCGHCCPKPEQEPVAWICEGSASDEKHAIDYWSGDVDDLPIGTQLYATPPQRTWVGLTDEEINAIPEGEYMDFYKAIEAMLKDRNT